MSGVVGIPTAEQGRWAAFWDSVVNLEMPPGTKIIQARGSSVARNRNRIVRQGLAQGAEWFFFLDDDMLFAPDVLTRLLAHDVDAVIGLLLGRTPPFAPLMYDAWSEDGRGRLCMPDKGGSGLIKIVAGTSGGFLVRRRVFEKMSDPWWTLGQMHPETWGDDLHFCKKLGEAGFNLWCDLDTPFGHIMSSTVWPFRDGEGNWSARQIRSYEVGQFSIGGQ